MIYASWNQAFLALAKRVDAATWHRAEELQREGKSPEEAYRILIEGDDA